jgi:Cu-Zn family superoxide dismutase
MITRAVAVFPGYGAAFLTQTLDGVVIDVHVFNLSPGLHGFHVHRLGNLLDNCNSVCSHYNPRNRQHGAPNSLNAHAGDLGNITANSRGECHDTFIVQTFTLVDVLGRSLVIHADTDDLGRGNNAESLRTGNSGSRITCGVIGVLEEQL